MSSSEEDNQINAGIAEAFVVDMQTSFNTLKEFTTKYYVSPADIWSDGLPTNDPSDYWSNNSVSPESKSWEHLVQPTQAGQTAPPTLWLASKNLMIEQGDTVSSYKKITLVSLNR